MGKNVDMNDRCREKIGIHILLHILWSSFQTYKVQFETHVISVVMWPYLNRLTLRLIWIFRGYVGNDS